MKRYNKILEVLAEKSEITINELCKYFDVSYDSIRRDLIKLEKDRLIIRKHGKVTIISSSSVETKPIKYKSIVASEAKNKVAKYAASLIGNNQLVFIDSGSSTINMYKYINQRNVTVVTNSIPLGIELNKKKINTFLIPGRYNTSHGSVSGLSSSKYLKNFVFDACFIASTGVDKELGFLVNSDIPCDIKKEAIKCSKKVYFLIDSSKYGKLCLFKIADIGDGVLITDVNNDYFPKNVKLIEVNKIYK